MFGTLGTPPRSRPKGMCNCEKIVASKQFIGWFGSGEYMEDDFTTLILIDSTGSLRSIEVRGKFTLEDFPEELRWIP